MWKWPPRPRRRPSPPPAPPRKSAAGQERCSSGRSESACSSSISSRGGRRPGTKLDSILMFRGRFPLNSLVMRKDLFITCYCFKKKINITVKNNRILNDNHKITKQKLFGRKHECRRLELDWLHRADVTLRVLSFCCSLLKSFSRTGSHVASAAPTGSSRSE